MLINSFPAGGVLYISMLISLRENTLGLTGSAEHSFQVQPVQRSVEIICVGRDLTLGLRGSLASLHSGVAPRSRAESELLVESPRASLTQ